MKGRIEALPVRLSGGEASLSHNGGAERMRAVFLERSDLPRPLEHEERWPEPTARAKPAVTPAPDARTLVATDADPVTLLPDGSAALYRSASGALWAVPLQRQEPTVFLSERRELQKAVTIGNARQIGIALIGYVQDYDETFPRPESDVAADVSPYVKNPDVFRNPATGAPGFTYVHPGVTHIGDVEVPKATVLAYLAGPGGRAVIYADGHVQWEEQ